MREHRNMFQMKEQINSWGKNFKETELNNLPDKRVQSNGHKDVYLIQEKNR